MTSMAAAIAAAAPAPQAQTQFIEKPTYEAIPASMAKVIDIEADIPITRVQIDALVISKIVKHGRETHFGSGVLLGLDFDGTMEVSNSFPLPGAGEDDERVTKSAAQSKYTKGMVSLLREVQGDENAVGSYYTTSLPFRQSLAETLANDYERLRHGGVVILHDPAQASRGIASLKAFRLTSNFVAAFKERKFTSQSLIDHGLTFSTIFEELPVTVRTSILASAFINQISQPSSLPSSSARSLAFSTAQTTPRSLAPLVQEYAQSLDLGNPPALVRNLEQVIESLENYRTEENNVAYTTRQIAREKAKVDTYVAKRKEENALRTSQGLAPYPDEDTSRLFKVPNEPSRLESMLLLGQIDSSAKNVEAITSAGLVKVFAGNPST